jgi:hypothetical protein
MSIDISELNRKKVKKLVIRSPLTEWGISVFLKVDKLCQTQKWLCDRIGISQAYLQDLMRGRRFNQELKEKINNFLDEELLKVS